MAQNLICPYWVVAAQRSLDDIDRLYRVDYQFTKIYVTNPSDEEGRMELVFYEQRGDGNFYRSDWAGGIWTVPPGYQRWHRPDPSRMWGDWFYTSGWFDVWLSRDDMVIDVSIRGETRSVISGGTDPSSGGMVYSTSQRTVHLHPKPIDFRERLRGVFLRPRSPLVFPPGTTIIVDTPPEEEPEQPD